MSGPAPDGPTTPIEGSAVATGSRVRAVGPATRRPTRRRGAGLPWVALMALVAVLLEVAVMPYLHISDGIPDLLAPTVVVVAMLRGPLVGAVTGFSVGMLAELIAPVGTLGVFALLYLVVGAWCGRYCERGESESLAPPLVLSVLAALAVQLGYMLFQLMLGSSMPASEFVAQLLLPTLLLTALLSPPVLLVGRRLLGAPRTVEFYGTGA